MLQPAIKAAVISTELTAYLTEGERLDEVSFRRYLRDIEALKDPVAEDYLKALVFGAYGREDDAIAHFERSLQVCHNEVVAKNFLVYLSDFGSLTASFTKSVELAEKYVSPFIYQHAYENCIFVGRMDLAEKYYHSYAKLFSGEALESMDNKLDDVLFEVNAFKQSAGFSGLEYECLFQALTQIMDSHKLHPLALKFYDLAEEKVNALVVVTKTPDVSLLADMNVELAFSVAEHDCFMHKNFSLWFEAEEQQNTQNSGSALLRVKRSRLNAS